MSLKVGELYGSLDLDNSQFDSKLDSAGGGFGKLAQVAGAAMLGVGVAIAGVAVKGVMAFADFEQGMNEVFTLMPGISQAAMGQMSDQVKQLATDFGILPDEVIPAMYQAISAGVPPDNIMSFMQTAAKASIAGVTSLETAVDGITSAVNAYGSSVLSAEAASDIMFTGVRIGKTTFEELSASLFNVAPVAASLGVSFGDVTAALAAMTAQGVPTAVATTELRQMFVELSTAGGDVDKTFREVAGVGFQDFIESGGNVQDALQLLEKAASDSGVNIKDLFMSVEAGQAATMLTGQGTAILTKNIEEMGKAAGATDQAYETMKDGVTQQFNKLKANLQVIMIEIGAALLPPITDAVQGVLVAFDSIKNWWTDNEPAIETAVESLSKKLKGLADDFIKARDEAGGEPQGQGPGDQPITEPAGAPPARPSYADYLKEEMDKLAKGDYGMGPEAVAQAAEEAQRRYDEAVQGIIDDNNQLSASEINTGLWDIAMEDWASSMGIASRTIEEILKPVLLGVGSVIGAVVVIAASEWIKIPFYVGQMIRDVINWFAQLLPAIGPALEGAWEYVSSGFMNLVGTVGGAIGSMVATVSTAFWTMVGAVASAVGSFVGSVAGGFASMVGAAAGAIGSIVGTVVGGFASVVGTIAGAMGSAIGSVASGFASMVSAAAGGVGSLIGIVSGIPGQILSALGDLGGLLYGAGSAIIGGLIDGLKSRLQEVYDLAASIASAIANVKGPLDYDRKLLIPHGRAIIEGLIFGISDSLPQLYGIVGAIAPNISVDTAAATSALRPMGSTAGATHTNTTIEARVIVEHPALEFLKDFIHVELSDVAASADSLSGATVSGYRLRPI